MFAGFQISFSDPLFAVWCGNPSKELLAHPLYACLNFKLC